MFLGLGVSCGNTHFNTLKVEMQGGLNQVVNLLKLAFVESQKLLE